METSVGQNGVMSAFPVDEATPEEHSRADDVTLLAGSSFIICDGAGDIRSDDGQGYGSHGFYAGDTRLISQFVLRVSGVVPRLLERSATEGQLTSTSVVGDPTRPELLITRRSELSD